MKTRSIHLGLGLGMSTFLLLASACATEGDASAFRGDEHESTGTDTGKTESGEDTHKDVGDTAGDTGGEGPCPRTQGYWRNHSVYAGPDQNQIPWPISEDTALCGDTWFNWLQTPPRGDAWIILVHQYIAARLNEAAGADVPDDVADALAAAEALLAGCSISDENRDDAIELSELLDAFNNGAFTESCGDGDDDDDDGDDGDDGDDDCDCDDDDDGDDGKDDDDHGDDKPCDDDGDPV
jgi:hypothetical protein